MMKQTATNQVKAAGIGRGWKKGLLTCLAVLLFSIGLHAEIIFLRDGRLLQVKILQGDERGIQVERLDTKGRLFIRWSLLREQDMKKLKVRFGLENDDSGADLLTDGHRVHPLRGEYYDGLIIEEDQKQIVLLHQGKRFPFVRTAIRRIENRAVSVFDIYTPEELYKQKLDELAPTDDDVVGHYELAVWATKVGMYAEALGHYTRIREEDPSYKADYVENQMKRLEVLDKNKEIQLAIRKAERAGYSHKYPECLAYFDEILAVTDLDAKLKKEVEKKRERFTKRRWAYYSTKVALHYHRQVRKRVDKLCSSKDIKAKDKKKRLTVAKAQSYVRSQLHKEIVDHLAKTFQLDPKKEVEKMWKERKVGGKRVATYGSGTFIVEGNSRNRNGGNNRRAQVLQRFRQAQGGGNQPQAAPPKLMTRDQWWMAQSASTRSLFLRAYFAENGKQMTIVSTSMRPCRNCGATGTIKSMGAQGAMTRQTCPRCQGTKGDKKVSYK